MIFQFEGKLKLCRDERERIIKEREFGAKITFDQQAEKTMKQMQQKSQQGEKCKNFGLPIHCMAF